jgi:phage tail protein X
MASFNYRINQGDRWDMVSQKMYGNLNGIDTLIQANPLIPIDTILPDGTILIIPIIDNTDETIIQTNLPPWK